MNKRRYGTEEVGVGVEHTPDIVRRKFMIRIRSRKYYGPYAMSPSGRYTLTWRDKDVAGGQIGGYRESGEGDYLLLEGEEILTEGCLERPNNGKVADNGTFILHDWHFGDVLSGTLRAFAKHGREIARKTFKANLLNNGLSSDGRFAVCQTANSSHPDGNTLTMFDLRAGRVLWQVTPVTGWSDKYEFDSEELILRLVYRDGAKYAYSLTAGDFLEPERWETERVDRAGPFELMCIARERLAGTLH